MALNKVKGNMYNFVTHTWNPIKGKCPHECSYCYMKRFPQGELRLDEKCFKDNLGEGNFIFVGSSTDMWADEIPSEWIWQIIHFIDLFDGNTYLFQSKNPKRFLDFENIFRGRYLHNIILATTLESHNDCYEKKAPCVSMRSQFMQRLHYSKKMITIEPIMDFEMQYMIPMIKKINPFQVNIGADSGGNNLPEPSADKIKALIKELRKFTKVHLKDNLKRLYKEQP